MRVLEVDFFDGKSSHKHKLILHVKKDYVYFPQKDWVFYFHSLKISPKIANTSQSIELPNGGYCILKKEDTLSFKNSFVLRLESKMLYAIFSIFLIVSLTFLTVKYGTSWSANIIANLMPQSAYDSLGESSFKLLKDGYLQASELDEKTKTSIQNTFKKIAPKNTKLHFYRSDMLKANALALPSGDIILLDDLIKMDKDKNYNGIAGVLGHEIGHVKQKHSMKNLIKTSIIGFLSAYFIGDISSIVASIGATMIAMNYSREFEKSADKAAVQTLKKHNLPIYPLINIFKQLEGKSSKNNFFSTHPIFEERIEFLRKSQIKG